MHSYINQVIKIEFLPCFRAAFNVVFTKSNIEASFQGAGLVPSDLETMILKLEVWLRTPTPLTINDNLWESRIPSNALEFRSQSKLI